MIMLLLLIFMLSGCANKQSGEEEAQFSLSVKEQEKYEQLIEDTFKSFYWRYDSDTIQFFQGTVPTADENAFLASEDAGYPLKKSAGKSVVVGTADMVHFNGDRAGLAYFYFGRNDILGVYYKDANTNKAYSLSNRNVFTKDVAIKAFESDREMGGFTEKKSKLPVTGFSSVGRDASGNMLLTCISGSSVNVYRYRNGFSLYKKIAYGGDGLVPLSVSFYNDGTSEADSIAVLLGSYVNAAEGHDSAQYSVADKVVFTDSSLNKTGEEIALLLPDYTCIASDGTRLVLGGKNGIEYYKKQDGAFVKERQFYLNHGVTQFKAEDLDGDGSSEYIMTDGMDLYLYTAAEGNFTNIWRTHLSIESLDGFIYTGDLNQDGVKEIYICDKTWTTIRYVLTPKGLVSRNDDIDYGQIYFAADFNQDGLDDYIKITDFENNIQSTFIAELNQNGETQYE